MNKLRPILSTLFLSLSFYLIGCSNNSKKSGAHAIFSTKAEAEKAAKDFSCAGAHRMGDKWMPCKSHDAHNEHHHNH